MKLILFGGSFNPIHTGHIELARLALQELEYDKLIFMPTFISPFKMDSKDFDFIAPIDRLNMVKSAIRGFSHFEASAYEIHKEKISFTIDTVLYLYEYYENKGQKIEGKIALLIGSDNLRDIPKWKDYEKLLELCDFVVAKRGNDSFEKVDFPYKTLPREIENISSTNIRFSIKTGRDWVDFVPKKVEQYIKDNALYGSPYENTEELILEIKNYAMQNLSIKRMAHSVRVAEMAEKLALAYPNLCVFPRLAYMAGIAHDITKEKSEMWQEKMMQRHKEKIDDIEKSNLRLLHGRTAAIILQKQFKIYNRSLLDAVRWHTLSHPYFDSLGKMLYVADKIEVERKGMDEIREMVGQYSLDSIMCRLLQIESEKLKLKGLKVHPYSSQLLAKLLKNQQQN